MIEINRKYIYPSNLKSAAKLWLWNLRDVALIIVSLIISILALTQMKIYFPLAFTFVYAFLTIRIDDRCVMDFIKEGARYFILTQQYFEWRMGNRNEKR